MLDYVSNLFPLIIHAEHVGSLSFHTLDILSKKDDENYYRQRYRHWPTTIKQGYEYVPHPEYSFSRQLMIAIPNEH